MNIRKILFKAIMLAGLVVLVLTFTGCFYSAPMGSLVTPAIKVVGPLDSVDAGSLTLKITGPDMAPMEFTYSELPETINIAIPEGVDRTFEISGTTGSSYTGTIASFGGSATADITQDSAVVTLSMGIESTKIIVPDTYNGRLVQIDNMNGDGWKTLDYGDLGFLYSSDFQPVDVDFDENGNMYVANNVSGSGGGIYVFNSINYTSIISTPVYSYDSGNGNEPITAVAVDRANNRVYGVAGNYNLYYWDLPGNITGQITLSGFSNVYGVAVDDDGNIYVGGEGGSSSLYMMIKKYSSTGSELATYDGAVGPIVADLTILNGELYASIGESGSVARIEKFDQDLNYLSFLGTFVQDPSGVGEFALPWKFLATMNDNLTVMDVDYFSNYDSRLVSFDNIAGDGWEPYGSIGSGIGEFSFLPPQ